MHDKLQISAQLLEFARNEQLKLYQVTILPEISSSRCSISSVKSLEMVLHN